MIHSPKGQGQKFHAFATLLLEKSVKMAFASGIAVRRLSTTASRLAVKDVTVIGGGLMGSGIAQVSLHRTCTGAL